jgi:hypothetical protein
MQDEDPSNRLTKIYGSASSDHWKQVIMMCQDVLHGVPSLNPGHRKLLRRRISDAHWRQARIAWAARQLRGGLRSTAGAAWVDPGALPSKVWNAFRRIWHGGRQE